MAIESMPWAAAASTSSVIRPRPSSRLNSEWTWRWVKSLGARVTGAKDTGRRLSGGRRTATPASRGAERHTPTMTDDADLEELVVEALERLPAEFRDRLG